MYSMFNAGVQNVHPGVSRHNLLIYYMALIHCSVVRVNAHCLMTL